MGRRTASRDWISILLGDDRARPDPSRWATMWRIGVLPALLAAAVFAGTLDSGFAYDDKWTFDILSKFTEAGWLGFLKSGRGLTYAVHRLDRLAWGDLAAGWHLTNLLLHSCATALAAVAAFVLTASPRTARVCGLLFAVHPVHVEAVASISYRKDLLAMVFVALALILWVTSRGSLARYGGSLGCLVLALLSKEVAAVCLPVMLFAADVLGFGEAPSALGKRVRRAVGRSLPFLLLGIVATFWLAGDISKRFSTESIRKTMTRRIDGYEEVLATAAGSAPTTMRLLVFPVRLSADYPVRNETSLSRPRPVAGILLWSIWIVGALLAARRAPPLTFAALWPVVMLLPCTNIVPLTQFFAADRYLYVPSFGICLLVAHLACLSLRSTSSQSPAWARKCIVGALVLLIVAGAGRSLLRSADWRDDRSLWSSAVRDGFESPRVYYNLGRALQNGGRLTEAEKAYGNALQLDPRDVSSHINLGTVLQARGDLDGAIDEFREALAIDANRIEARYNLAVALRQRGRLEEAIGEFRAFIRADPNDARARNNLGALLQTLGRVDEAAIEYLAAVAIDPQHGEAYFNLGVILYDRGRIDEAIEALSNAARINPRDVEARYRLGDSLGRQGSTGEAVGEYRAVLELDPDHVGARRNLGIALHRQGRLDEAIEELRRLALTAPRDAVARYNLAVVLADRGRLEDAVVEYRAALALAPRKIEAQYGLGKALEELGRFDEAITAYEDCLAIATQYTPALGRLAWLRAACPKRSLRNGVEAISLARRACDATGDSDPRFLFYLAAAYAEAGRFDRALELARRASDLAASRPGQRLNNDIRLGIALFEAGKAWPTRP